MKSTLSLAALFTALLWSAMASAAAVAPTDAGLAQTALTAISSAANTPAAVEANTITAVGTGLAQTAPTAIKFTAGTLVATAGTALYDAVSYTKPRELIRRVRTADPTNDEHNRWGPYHAAMGVARASPAVAPQLA